MSEETKSRRLLNDSIELLKQQRDDALAEVERLKSLNEAKLGLINVRGDQLADIKRRWDVTLAELSRVKNEWLDSEFKNGVIETECADLKHKLEVARYALSEEMVRRGGFGCDNLREALKDSEVQA